MGDRGICVIIRGEKGDKHPNLLIILAEESFPGYRQIWEQGRQVELLAKMNEVLWNGQGMNPNQVWQHMLSIKGELGDFARRREAGLR
jgi:hypothetical protein